MIDTKQLFDNIKKISFNTNTELVPYLPAPRKFDYDNGYIVRYFARIVNDEAAPIVEIRKAQFNNIKSNPVFISTSFRWKIIQRGADEIPIIKSNKLILLFNEQVIPGISDKLPNLRQFDKTLADSIKFIISKDIRKIGITENNTGTGVAVIPDTTIPTLVSSVVNTGSPTNIILTYDELIDPDSVPLITDYSVNLGRTVTGVTISGVTVIVIVDTAFVESDSGITITYTEGVSPIQDLAGNNAANLVNQPVTNNVIDDVIAPVLSTATVEDAAADQIILTYDETLDAGSVPAITDYSVSGGMTVTNVAVSGLIVTITLDSEYVYGDVITISYTAGANPIQDSSANASVNLTNEPVTNNVVATGFTYTFPITLS